MFRILLWLYVCILLGCGVRGNPVPPEHPAELGRQRPSYKDPRNVLPQALLPSASDLSKQLEEEEKEDE